MKKTFITILLIGFLFSLSADEPQKPLKFSRTQTEWVSLAFVGGNYGLGATLSFATLRWKYFYWEVAKAQFTATKGLYRNNLVGKTIVGFPLFLTQNNRHELRFGTGLSGGITQYLSKEGTAGSADPKFKSFIHIPVEVSYIFHISKHFSMQMGVSVDFPVLFNDADTLYYTAFVPTRTEVVDAGYYPILNGFFGFRI